MITQKDHPEADETHAASVDAPAVRFGRYELVAEIARGGMGTVYLARLASAGGFKRLFAVKVLHPHLAREPEFISMFLDEACLASHLHHPNAVPILDVGQMSSGYYLVMEYIDGFTLKNLLDELKDDAPRRIRLCLRVLVDASAGLDAAHRLMNDDGEPIGLVHRDVSPHNILVGTDGIGRITDFGIARGATRITASQPGSLKGKPAYMSPEQVRGEDLDARSDVFALGIILWEILTGQRLFASESGSAGELFNVVLGDIQPPRDIDPEVPSALEALCMQALERAPSDRVQSARAFTRALEAAARTAGLLASTSETADAIAELFQERIATRNARIRRKLAAASAPRAERQGEEPETTAQLSSLRLPSFGSSINALDRTPGQPPSSSKSRSFTATTLAGGSAAALSMAPEQPSRLGLFIAAFSAWTLMLFVVFWATRDREPPRASPGAGTNSAVASAAAPLREERAPPPLEANPGEPAARPAPPVLAEGASVPAPSESTAQQKPRAIRGAATSSAKSPEPRRPASSPSAASKPPAPTAPHSLPSPLPSPPPRPVVGSDVEKNPYLR